MPQELFQTVGPKRSAKAARLREVLPSIEAALSQGHGHAGIHQRLAEELGLDITFNYYQLIVHRLRKERDGAAPGEVAGVDSLIGASAQAADRGISAKRNEDLTPVPPVTETPSGRKITSTADTVRIRRPQIDLEDL